MAVCDSASVLIKILHKKTDISIAEYPFFYLTSCVPEGFLSSRNYFFHSNLIQRYIIAGFYILIYVFWPHRHIPG